MAKIWIQYATCPWGYSGSLDANASTAGSFSTLGYARLTGIVYSSCALDTASGVLVRQSGNGGVNWDHAYASTVNTGGGSAFALEVYGDAAQVLLKMGAASGASVRAAWHLRPIA